MATQSPNTTKVQVPEVQIDKAVGALLSYLKTKEDKNSMFDVDEYFLLTVNLRKVPNQTRKTPMRIPLPNSIYHREDVSIALVTKTQRESERRLEDYPVENIKEIVSLQTLREDMKAFQHRREFLKKHNLFFVDKNLYEVAVPLFGSKFTGPKSVIPVDIDTMDWSKSLSRARDSTYMLIKSGVNVTVRVGHNSQTRKEIVENIAAVLPKMIEKIGNVQMIQSIAAHTESSIILPLWNQLATVETFAHTPEEKAEVAADEAHRRANKDRRLAEKFEIPAKQVPGLRKKADEEGLDIKDLFAQHRKERLERQQLEQLNKRQQQLEAMKRAAAELDDDEDEEEEDEEDAEDESSEEETKSSKSKKSVTLENDDVDNLFFDDDDDEEQVIDDDDDDELDEEESEEEERVVPTKKGKATSSRGSKKPAATKKPVSKRK